MPIVDPNYLAIMTIIGEAASEPFEGQLAVARVIRNRMKRKYASDGTIIGTVLRPKQFSMWDDNARLYAANVDVDSPTFSQAAEAWQASRLPMVSRVNDAVLYHTIDVDPYWADAPSVSHVATIGRHRFYEDRGGA